MDRAFLPSPTLPSTKLPKATVRSVVTVCVLCSYPQYDLDACEQPGKAEARRPTRLLAFFGDLSTERPLSQPIRWDTGFHSASCPVCVCVPRGQRSRKNKQTTIIKLYLFDDISSAVGSVCFTNGRIGKRAAAAATAFDNSPYRANGVTTGTLANEPTVRRQADQPPGWDCRNSVNNRTDPKRGS